MFIFQLKKSGGFELILNAVRGASEQPRSQAIFVARGGGKETRDVAVGLSAIQSNPKITSEGRPLCSILAERKPESTCITSALPFHENVLK